MTRDPKWSYSRHEEQESAVVHSDDVPSCYATPESVDAWRHARMHATLLPLIKEFPNASWLTIGDGRFGSDAYYLETQKVEVVASSLTDVTLRIAKDRGYIRNFRAENAEKISLPDDSVDLILCKESFHHLPRPSIAFYEMLRVSKFGIVLIEPIEEKGILNPAKNIAKKLIRGDQTTLFEPCGNFLFRVNIQEIQKKLTALNFQWLSVRYFNDFYHPKFNQTRHSMRSLVGLATRAGIFVQNLLCKLGLLEYGLATIFVPKTILKEPIVSTLKENGYKIFELPKNPYI